MADQLGLTLPAPLSVTTLAVNLLIGTVLAFVLAWHYKRFGKTYSNRSELAQVFPLIVLTMILIISVVKSSLALSLGLVGALSIVRFRTPIKEPEELTYIFMAIAIGLGCGAGQLLITGIVIPVIMLANYLRQKFSHGTTSEYNFVIDMPTLEPDGAARVSELIKVLQDQLGPIKISKLEVHPESTTLMAQMPVSDA